MTSISERTRSFLIYAVKCITGTLSVYFISSLISYVDVGWSLISVVLILSPDGKDSITLAVIRIKANIIGALVGLLCLLVTPATAWMIAIALIGTLLFCFVFSLDAGIRSALAATIIVMLHHSQHSWDIALERIVAVMVGCLIGLLSTFIFHFKMAGYNKCAGSREEG